MRLLSEEVWRIVDEALYAMAGASATANSPRNYPQKYDKKGIKSRWKGTEHASMIVQLHIMCSE